MHTTGTGIPLILSSHDSGEADIVLVGVQGLPAGAAVPLQGRHRTEPSALPFGNISGQEVAALGHFVLHFNIAAVYKQTFPAPGAPTRRIHTSLTDVSSFSFPVFPPPHPIYQIESGHHGKPRAGGSRFLSARPASCLAAGHILIKQVCPFPDAVGCVVQSRVPSGWKGVGRGEHVIFMPVLNVRVRRADQCSPSETHLLQKDTKISFLGASACGVQLLAACLPA